jgi:hypothetical protein
MEEAELDLARLDDQSIVEDLACQVVTEAA